MKNGVVSQPRMRLDLPPGGFLRPPEAALAPPEGAESCDDSFCCWSCSSGSTSSGQSTEKHLKKGTKHYFAGHSSGWYLIKQDLCLSFTELHLHTTITLWGKHFQHCSTNQRAQWKNMPKKKKQNQANSGFRHVMTANLQPVPDALLHSRITTCWWGWCRHGHKCCWGRFLDFRPSLQNVVCFSISKMSNFIYSLNYWGLAMMQIDSYDSAVGKNKQLKLTC